jgi:hypothetical protein
MELPARINAQWISSLRDDELLGAEAELRAAFSRAEADEKRERGERYELRRGSEGLMNAWQRWSLVNSATRARGLRPNYRR